MAESWQNLSSLIPSSTPSKDAHLTLLFSSTKPRTSYVLGCYCLVPVQRLLYLDDIGDSIAKSSEASPTYGFSLEIDL